MLFEFNLAAKKFVAKNFLYVCEIPNEDSTKELMEMLFGLERGGHSQVPRNIGTESK